MANSIPCPNPICTHAFSQTELQSAAHLLCPKCGFRMQGKAAAKSKPATAKVVKPVAEPAPPLIAQPAKVVKAGPTMAVPVVAEPAPAPPDNVEFLADDASFQPPDETDSVALIRTTPRANKFNWLRFALMMLATGFVLCVAIVGVGIAYFVYRGTDSGNNGGATLGVDEVAHTGSLRDAKGVSEKIYRLVLGKKEWSVDNEVIARLKAHTAWKHNEHDFWFAIVLEDHKVFKPRDADMLRVAIDKLESQFGDALELGAKAEPSKINGLPAQKIQFKGQIKSANWLGECYMFFKDGVAFYLFLASPDWAVVEKFAIALPEKHFSVLVERRGWREQPAPMELVASLNGKLAVSVPKGVWERANPKDEDENGELFVVGKYQKEKDNRKNASLLIFTIPKKDDLKDAMKAGREYVDNKIKNDMTNFKIVHANEVSEGQPEIGTVEDVGNRRGRIVDLKKMFNEEAKRYYLMAVINEPDLAYVVLCDCAWESRQIWRQDFLEILRSLQFKKGE